VVLRKDRFDDREMDFYEALYTQSQAQFGAFVEAGTILSNYAHIFDLLIRLRQVSAFPGRPPIRHNRSGHYLCCRCSSRCILTTKPHSTVCQRLKRVLYTEG
jgi:hypothetical protein